VKFVRLNYADAETLVKELSRIFPADDLRIVADKRTNSVVMAAPAATADTVTNLIAKLDVPQVRVDARTSHREVKSEVIPLREVNPDLVAEALSELVAARQARGQGSTIAVVKASPSVQKALEAVLQPQTDQQGKGQYRVLKPLLDDLGSPPGTAGNRLEILHLSDEQATALRKALAGALSTKSPKPGVIVVVPQGARSLEAPTTGSNDAPTLR
jgi:type II secretory pathway component GspD/PulD (secretin)